MSLVTDAAFVHLRGIHTLTMIDCKQAGITDAAFAHLRGIHKLDMRQCNQEGGIATLDLSYGRFESVSDAAWCEASESISITTDEQLFGRSGVGH